MPQIAAVIPFKPVRPRAELKLRVDQQGPSIRVLRADNEQRVAAWYGSVARELLGAPALRRIACGDGDFPCAPVCANRIILAAAAVEAGLEAMRARRDEVLTSSSSHAEVAAGRHDERLGDRLARLGVTLNSAESFIARLLFAHPGRHFNENDVRCLTAMTAPADLHVDAPAVLSRLSAAGVVQRIDVDDAAAFYDIDTRPHAHVFDATTGELHDAC